MIKRVFRFCDRRARALMTPRSDVVWLDVADSPEEIRSKIISSHHTRFPVCDQSLDNLLGIVQIKDLLAGSRPASSRSGSRGASLCLSSSTKELAG